MTVYILVGRLVGLLTCWMLVPLDACLIGYMVVRLTDWWLADILIGWLADWLVSCLDDWLVLHMVPLTNMLTHNPTGDRLCRCRCVTRYVGVLCNVVSWYRSICDRSWRYMVQLSDSRWHVLCDTCHVLTDRASGLMGDWQVGCWSVGWLTVWLTGWFHLYGIVWLCGCACDLFDFAPRPSFILFK